MGIGNISTGKVAAASDVRMLQTQYKVQTFGRLLSAASGNVAYTGYGFKPRALMGFGGDFPAGVQSVGSYASTHGCMFHSASTAYQAFSSSHFLIFGQQGPSSTVAGQFASVTSLDADGFTLMWTGSRTATASADFSIMAYGDSTSL